MRCAIVHYWLLGMRGGEKVVEGLSRLLPEAHIYTLFYDPERVSPLIRSRVVRSSFLNPFRRIYRSLLPLMPMALEAFDLRDYDLVISSESGPAKGVLVSSQARHICYCHSPMRYLWDLYPAYLHEWTPSICKRALMMPLTNYLRLWDYASAARVDEFVANSENVQTASGVRIAAIRNYLSSRPSRNVLHGTRRRLLSDRFRTGAIQTRRRCRTLFLKNEPQLKNCRPGS